MGQSQGSLPFSSNGNHNPNLNIQNLIQIKNLQSNIKNNPNEGIVQIRSLIETGESNKFKQTTTNSYTNSTHQIDEYKILSSSGVETVEELHFKILSLLSAYIFLLYLIICS